MRCAGWDASSRKGTCSRAPALSTRAPSESQGANAVLAHLVADDRFAGLKQPACASAVSAGALERVEDQVFLVLLQRAAERGLARRMARLQLGGKGGRVDDVGLARAQGGVA